MQLVGRDEKNLTLTYGGTEVAVTRPAMQLVGRDEKNVHENYGGPARAYPAMQLVGRDEKNP